MARARTEGGPVGRYGKTPAGPVRKTEGLPIDAAAHAEELFGGQAVQHLANQQVPGSYRGRPHSAHPTTPKADGAKE
jgi:hypothetical protein